MHDEGTYPVINGGINPSGYIEQYNQEEKTITRVRTISSCTGRGGTGISNDATVDFASAGIPAPY